jgi:hypothetical protein
MELAMVLWLSRALTAFEWTFCANINVAWAWQEDRAAGSGQQLPAAGPARRLFRTDL